MKTLLVFLVLVLAGAIYAEGAQKAGEGAVAEARPIMVDASDLPPELLQKIQTKQKLKEYGEYAKWGHEIGVAVSESLDAVSENATKLADTNVGKVAVFLVAWKVMAKDIVHLSVGIPFVFLGICIVVWSYWRNCVPRRVLVKQEEKIKTFELKAGTRDEDLRWQYALWHAVIFLIVVIIGCLMIFARG